MGGKNAFDLGNTFVAKGRENGRSNLKEIGGVINREHVPTALTHHGEGAGIAYDVKNYVSHVSLDLFLFEPNIFTE
jgi:hypothetical protein